MLRERRKGADTRARWKEAELKPKIAAIIADLLHARCTGKTAIGVHCNPKSAWMREPYRHPKVQTSRLSPLLNEMSQAGIIDVRRFSEYAGKVSRVSRGPWLEARFNARPWSTADVRCEGRGPQSIVLKEGKGADGSGPTIPYRDTPAICVMRKRLEALNEWIAGFEISLNFEGSENSVRELDVRNRTLHRIFNNGSFQSHGRLYGGFWINMGKHQRWRIRLNGQPLAYLDFKSLNVQLCYARAQKPLPKGDLYEWTKTRRDKLKRDTVKAVLNARLNGYHGGPKYPRLAPGDPTDLFPDPKDYSPNKMLATIAEHHSNIAHLFGQRVEFKTHDHYTVSAAIGHALTFAESEIVLDALCRCRKENIPALPVHDALLVPVIHCKRAAVIMSEAFEMVTRATGAVSPPRIDVEMLTPMRPTPAAFKAAYDGVWHDTEAGCLYDPMRLVKLDGEPLRLAERVYKHYATIEYGLLTAQAELGAELPPLDGRAHLLIDIFFGAANYARWVALYGETFERSQHQRKYEKRAHRRSVCEQGRREARQLIYWQVKCLWKEGHLEELERELDAIERRQRSRVAVDLCVTAARALGQDCLFFAHANGDSSAKPVVSIQPAAWQLRLTYQSRSR